MTTNSGASAAPTPTDTPAGGGVSGWGWITSWRGVGAGAGSTLRQFHPQLAEAMAATQRVGEELYNIRRQRRGPSTPLFASTRARPSASTASGIADDAAAAPGHADPATTAAVTTAGASAREKREAIVCLVGSTSCGKSALIKALIRMPHDDRSIAVSRTAHTTLMPSRHSILDDHNSVLHLVDLPGTHGALPSGVDEQRDRQFLDQLDEIVSACCRHADLILYCYSGPSVADYMVHDVQRLQAARPEATVLAVLTKSDLVLANFSEASNRRLLAEHQQQLQLLRPPFPTTCIGYDPDDERYGQLTLLGVHELRLALLQELEARALLAPSFIEKLRSGEYNNTIRFTTVTAAAVAAGIAVAASPAGPVIGSVLVWAGRAVIGAIAALGAASRRQ